MLKRVIRGVLASDPSGLVLKLSQPTFTVDPNTVKTGSGVYAAGEWSETRRKGHSIYGTDGTEYDSDQKFFRFMMRNEATKVHAALDLTARFDFGRYQSILELGAGAVIQGAIIKSRIDRQYCASDYDPFVTEKVAKLSLVSGITTRVIDATRIGPDDLKGFDLVVSWGLDYALDDDALVRLFRSCVAARLDYLMCSASTTTLLNFLVYRLRRRRIDARISRREMRAHGWSRSVALLRAKGREAGLPSEYLGKLWPYQVLLFRRRHAH